jgi:hypothetical protein
MFNAYKAHNPGIPWQCENLNTIKSSKQCCSRYGHLVDKTRDVLRMVPVWHIIHVQREGNSTAHDLAKAAVKHVINQV